MQVTDWSKDSPNRNPPPEVTEADSHKHPEFQEFHRDKMGDIKDKMEQIAEAQTHLDDMLNRIGEKREKVVVRKTVGSALTKHEKAERKYLEEESERRIRGVFSGKHVTPMSYDPEDVVDDVAPKPATKPKTKEQKILAEHDRQVAAVKKECEAKKGTPEEKECLAKLREAKLPPNMVPAFECDKKTGKAKEECIKGRAKAEEKAEKVEQARKAERNLAIAKETGDPKLIAAAAEKMEDSAAALHPGKSMPETVVREIERVRTAAREKAEAERKEKSKKMVEGLVQKAVEKREQEKRKVAEAVKQRREMIEKLHNRQKEAKAMKEKAAEMVRQARAAKTLAQAKLVEAKNEGKELGEMDAKLQDVTASMAKRREKQNEGVKDLLDVQPDF